MTFEFFVIGIITVMIIMYGMAWIMGHFKSSKLPKERVEYFFISLGFAFFVTIIASIN